MRIKILLILLLICQHNFGQTDSLNFKKSTFINGIPYRTDTISFKKSNKLIDIYFFKKHFFQFYGLPKTLINKKLENQEITEWAFENKSKERDENWTEFYKYDSEGKLIEYKYSGCTICSQFSSGYKLIYNKNNNVIEQQIFNLTPKPIIKNGIIKTEFDFKDIIEQIKLTYDNEGNIVKLEKFGIKKLEVIIELLE